MNTCRDRPAYEKIGLCEQAIKTTHQENYRPQMSHITSFKALN